ncbi:hypothetical protein [Natrinema salaciae]|uniref:Uncharacterized protein n=1 Tax=Natrinema salaciae TaxID=1186196 RepID=A0A1H9ERF6_9EURY|nr:hypothetical protein [Natrinema salaciae]SEQ28187.1 hypothetical protein SAMN04489841_1361 [Natrinema salaciae]
MSGDISHAERNFDDEDLFPENEIVPSLNRYALDLDREEFTAPSNEPTGAYSHAVNYFDGVVGRIHESYVSAIGTGTTNVDAGEKAP